MEVSSHRVDIDLFVDSFYFGCEADDRGITTAFAPSNPGGGRLRAMFSSDIGPLGRPGHERRWWPSRSRWSRRGSMTADQWRQVVFDNPVEMYTRANPRFFDGTPVEAYLPGVSTT